MSTGSILIWNSVVFLSIGLLVSVAHCITDVDQTCTYKRDLQIKSIANHDFQGQAYPEQHGTCKFPSQPSPPPLAVPIRPKTLHTNTSLLPRSVVLLSIITATIPRTNTFWVSLKTGKSGVVVTEYELSDSRSQGGTLAYAKGTVGGAGGSSTQSQTRSQIDEPGLRSANAHLKLIPRSGGKVSTKIFAERDNGSDESELVAGRAPVGGLEDDERSQKSLGRRAGGLGIYRNTEVSVVEEHIYQRDR